MNIGDNIKIVAPIDNAINHLRGSTGIIQEIKSDEYPIKAKFPGCEYLIELKECEVEKV